MALHIGEEAPILLRRPQKEPSTSMIGLGTGGPFFFPIRKISPRFARQSSATWRVSNRSSRSETVK